MNTTWLSEKIKRGHFAEIEAAGDVRVIHGPDGLVKLNYTQRCQFAGRWNHIERISRGIIFSADGEVVARPFDKFFNWLEKGEKAGGHIVSITEKVDGSMGTLYRHNGYKIATRGPFDSEQAVWATTFLNTHFDLLGLPDEWTLIFEIVYPANRVVVDYHGREDLVLLAIRNRHTGKFAPFFPVVYETAQKYGFSLPKVYNFNNVSEIIENTGTWDANTEGVVVEFSDGSRWKFKGDRYLELHQLVTGLTFRRAVEAVEFHAVDSTRELLPDELDGLFMKWVAFVKRRFADIESEDGDTPKPHHEIYRQIASEGDGLDIETQT